MAAKGGSNVGDWAFLLGVLVAIIVGLFGTFAYSALILFVLGLIVGFMNIAEKETGDFLIATIALLAVAATAGVAGLQSLDDLIPVIGDWLAGVVNSLVAFVAPAALVVALKQVYSLAKSK